MAPQPLVRRRPSGPPSEILEPSGIRAASVTLVVSQKQDLPTVDSSGKRRVRALVLRHCLLPSLLSVRIQLWVDMVRGIAEGLRLKTVDLPILILICPNESSGDASLFMRRKRMCLSRSWRNTSCRSQCNRSSGEEQGPIGSCTGLCSLPLA